MLDPILALVHIQAWDPRLVTNLSESLHPRLQRRNNHTMSEGRWECYMLWNVPNTYLKPNSLETDPQMGFWDGGSSQEEGSEGSRIGRKKDEKQESSLNPRLPSVWSYRKLWSPNWARDSPRWRKGASLCHSVSGCWLPSVARVEEVVPIHPSEVFPIQPGEISYSTRWTVSHSARWGVSYSARWGISYSSRWSVTYSASEGDSYMTRWGGSYSAKKAGVSCGSQHPQPLDNDVQPMKGFLVGHQ